MSDDAQLLRIDDFIQEEVKDWTAYMLDRLRSNVRAKGIVDSGDFLESLAATAAKEGLQMARSELMFDTHGRMADMGARRGWHKGIRAGDDGSDRMNRLKPPRGNKVYSRTAYGTLSTLMNNLANKYVELVPDLIKQPIADGQR